MSKNLFYTLTLKPKILTEGIFNWIGGKIKARKSRLEVTNLDRIKLLNSLGISMDLALEATEALRGQLQKEIPGVSEDKKEFPHGTVTTIKILDDAGVKIMGKPIGTYITIEAPELRINHKEVHSSISNILAEQIRLLLQELNLDEKASVLLVGLGNWNATPDALGPQVINKCLVTRHIFHYAPQELQGGLREVSAVAPGVLGITGIETAEIIKGIVDRLQPNVIIAIDALAATNLHRISTTIQLTNTGINPGSGIGNKRAGINSETMGVPVIAIGVPTVVHAAVIAFEIYGKITAGNPYLTQQFNEEKLHTIIQQSLEPFGGQLTVTPKEIDEMIENCARVIAEGLNQGLHPGITPENSAYYI